MLVGTGQLGNDFDREIRNLLLTEGRKLYGVFSVAAVDADFGFPINCAMIRHLTVGERQNSARRCDITLGGIFLCFQNVVWKLYFKRFFNFLFSSLGWWYFLFRPSSNTALSAVLTSLSVKADA